MQKLTSQPKTVTSTSDAYPDRKSLLDDLAQEMQGWSGKTLLLGGHYRLYYRQSERRFVPLMESVALQDTNSEQREKEQLKEIGDFPEASFNLSLDLLQEASGLDVKIVLLVDDGQFRRYQEGPVREDLAQRRREFYRSRECVPAFYRRALEKYGFAEEQVIERCSQERPPESTLPSDSVVLSEHVLKKSFSRGRKEWLLEQPGFARESTPLSTSRLVFCGPGKVDQRDRCYLGGFDEGSGQEEEELDSIACSSTAIELLLKLADLGAKNLVLIIPHYCRQQVDISVRATLSSLVEFNKIIVIWGKEVIGRQGDFGFEQITKYQIGSGVD